MQTTLDLLNESPSGPIHNRHPRLHAVTEDADANAFVLTIIAPDAIGVARTAVDLPGTNIDSSRGGRSGSQFWLVTLVRVDPAEREAFLRAIVDLPSRFAVQLVPSRIDSSCEVLGQNEYVLTYANHNREGLMQGFTACVAEAQGDIRRIGGSRVPAAFDGASLFVMRAIVRCPDRDALERALETHATREGGEFSIGGRFSEIEPLAENEIADAARVFDS